MSYIIKHKKTIIIFSWAIIMILLVFLTYNTSKSSYHKYYDLQKEASNLTLDCFNSIKNKKEELGIFSDHDSIDSGMIGSSYNEVTTTSGDLKSKISSVNPNFAAVYIDMFHEASLKPNDQIACMLSGSFPAWDIALICAIETFELDACIMASIGASTYGANDVEFTIFDMLNHLYDEGLLTNKIDYVSFGGNHDDGSDFPNDFKVNIEKRFKESGVNVLYPESFTENVALRKELIYKECPFLKMFVSVGGTLVAMGKNTSVETYSYCGLVFPDYMQSNTNIDVDSLGLLDVFLMDGIPVVQMLNAKGLCTMYGLTYDPLVMEEISEQKVYYDVSYNLVFPILGIIVSLGIGLYFYLERKKIYNSIK